MANNCRMDGSNFRRVQGKLVGYSEDHTNINHGAFVFPRNDPG
jgi:hypothetical protein